METLKYKVIKTANQYQDYCAALEELLNTDINNSCQDEVELLTLLIEKWDHEHNSFEDAYSKQPNKYGSYGKRNLNAYCQCKLFR